MTQVPPRRYIRCYIVATSVLHWWCRSATQEPHGRYILLLPRCYIGATWVAPRCYRGATQVLYRCYLGVTWVRCFIGAGIRCSLGATQGLPRCHRGATEVPPRSSRGAIEVLPMCYLGAT